MTDKKFDEAVKVLHRDFTPNADLIRQSLAERERLGAAFDAELEARLAWEAAKELAALRVPPASPTPPVSPLEAVRARVLEAAGEPGSVLLEWRSNDGEWYVTFWSDRIVEGHEAYELRAVSAYALSGDVDAALDRLCEQLLARREAKL